MGEVGRGLLSTGGGGAAGLGGGVGAFLVGDGVAALRRELHEHGCDGVYLGAAAALAEVRTPRTQAALVEMIPDESWSVRVEVLHQLLKARPKAAIPVLIERMTTERGRLASDVHAALARHYQGQRFVTVVPLSDSLALTHLEPEELNGTNELRLIVCANEAEGHAVLIGLVDNLGKGASGQAVQIGRAHV